MNRIACWLLVPLLVIASVLPVAAAEWILCVERGPAPHVAIEWRMCCDATPSARGVPARDAAGMDDGRGCGDCTDIPIAADRESEARRAPSPEPLPRAGVAPLDGPVPVADAHVRHRASLTGPAAPRPPSAAPLVLRV